MAPYGWWWSSRLACNSLLHRGKEGTAKFSTNNSSLPIKLLANLADRLLGNPCKPMMQDPEIFRTVLESLPIGVYMVDRDLKVIFWNRGAERISGYLAQDVIGRHCREKLLVGLDESDPATGGEASQLTNSLRDGQPIEADVFLRHRSGHRIPVHVCAVPLRNSQDKIVGAAEIFEENRF